jgi:NADH-ubiquinone oxidoreductase chain 4
MFVARQKIIFSEHEPKIFRITTYILSFILVEAYSTPNLLNFYILFEASLIPTLILILSWGLQPERLQAGTYLIIYIIVASLPLLFSIILMYRKNHHLDLYLPYWAPPVSSSFFLL